jgi:caffeoyl-CoA O-methyltransferase
MTSRPMRPAADPEMGAYAASHTTPSSELLRDVAAATTAWTEYPTYMIDEAEGQLLRLLVGISGARRILEVGTFTAYSALAMVEALPPEGHVDTLELSSEHAAKAAEHIAMADEMARITIHEGNALDTLARLDGPYDMAFIDADKPAYPAYYDAIVPLMRPGGLIVADNVFRRGRVLDAENPDPGVTGMREFNDKVVSDRRVEVVMLTIRDGVTLIRVRD